MSGLVLDRTPTIPSNIQVVCSGCLPTEVCKESEISVLVFSVTVVKFRDSQQELCMTPNQRYLFDINGYLHIPQVLNAEELAAA